MVMVSLHNSNPKTPPKQFHSLGTKYSNMSLRGSSHSSYYMRLIALFSSVQVKLKQVEHTVGQQGKYIVLSDD